MNESSPRDDDNPQRPPPDDGGGQRDGSATFAGQNAWVRAVLDAAVEGMIIIDRRGIVESINPSATSIFGYSSREVIGQNVSMLMASPFREAHDDYLQRYGQTGERHVIGIGREVVGRRKDGTEVPLDLSVSEVKLGEQQVFIGTLRDLTERRLSQQRARQHEAQLSHISRVNLMGEMVASIAHELNQPLAAITAFASACKSQVISSGTPAGNGNLVEMLDQIDEQIHRAAEIIRRLRRLARKSEPHRSSIAPNALVDESISLIEADARLKDIEIVTDLNENLPSVVVDQFQIEQVLISLLRNAFDAVEGRRPRAVSVSTRLTEQQMIEVEVHDTGSGVAAEDLPKVFEAFYTTKPGGVGMGLTICRSIVEAHDGKISVATDPAGGASFRFTLPVVEAQSEK